MLLTKTEIENVLRSTLPGAQENDIRKAASSLMETRGEWQEIDVSENLGATMSVQCKDICPLGEAYHKGHSFRVFVKGH